MELQKKLLKEVREQKNRSSLFINRNRTLFN